MKYPHWLYLYDKPKIGSSFIRRYQAYAYRHKISAMGWFDTASCNLVVPRSEAERWIDQYLGNRVAFYVDNPVELIWEGLVSRVIYQIGGVIFTASIDEMYNRVKTIHQTGGGAVPTTSAASDTTDSQAIYGIKQGTIDLKIQYLNSTLPAAYRQNIINLRAWPQVSTAINGSGGLTTLSVELVGFYQTLQWEDRASALTTAAAASTVISEVIAALANGTTFFDNADASLIDTNASFNQQRTSRNAQSAWEFIRAIQEAGDGSTGNQWICGITPTDHNIGTRRFYYQKANATVEYTMRLADGLRIRNTYGGIVKPWRVVPDRGVRLLDALVGWNGPGDDPRESYIEVVDYDAETQQINWQSSDDIEIEGAFQLRRYFKAHDTRFGENVRNYD